MTHQILTGHPIDLKLVANRLGWILMNLQIPQAQHLSALICFIAIMMVGGAETAPPPTFLGDIKRVRGCCCILALVTILVTLSIHTPPPSFVDHRRGNDNTGYLCLFRTENTGIFILDMYEN